MTEDITESAKAVQEIAKVTGQAIGVVERVGQFFATVMGESIDATCGMLADSLKFRRWKRQLRLVDRCEELIVDRKLSGKCVPIPPKIALPIFHYASLEEDDLLQDLWANLLVAALDPKSAPVRSAFIGIINELDPLDVRILDSMYTKFEGRLTTYRDDPTRVQIHAASLRTELNLQTLEFRISVDNLMRLQLVTSFVESQTVQTGSELLGENIDTYKLSRHHGYDRLCMTPLGLAFVQKCVRLQKN